MKFKRWDTIADKTGNKLEIIDCDNVDNEYAILNCLGRRVWLSAKDIDKNYKLSTPIHITAAFNF